jgi:hypothetical protein
MIIVVSMTGVSLEPLMMVGVVQVTSILRISKYV